MRVVLRLQFEMNRQLQDDAGLTLADYDVLVALSNAPGGRLQLSDLAATIGWERSRLSTTCCGWEKRGLVDRLPSESDGRATDAVLTSAGRRATAQAAPGHVARVRELFFGGLQPRALPSFTKSLGADLRPPADAWHAAADPAEQHTPTVTAATEPHGRKHDVS
jgi:DNA-binding MarR family transcriptional regulator